MDWVRACYRTKMKLFKDSEEEHEVIWYFCPEDAKPFPGPHLFASGIWCEDKVTAWVGPGEVQFAPRPFSHGLNPWGYLGKCLTGEEQWFREGAPVAILDGPALEEPCCREAIVGGVAMGGEAIVGWVPPPDNEGVAMNGTAAVEYHPAPGLIGGVLVDGEADITYTPGGPPVCDTTGVPSTLNLAVTESGTCDGSYTLTKVAGEWRYTGALGSASMASFAFSCPGGPATWRLVVVVPPAAPANYDATSGTNGPPLDITFDPVDLSIVGGNADSVVTITG